MCRQACHSNRLHTVAECWLLRRVICHVNSINWFFSLVGRSVRDVQISQVKQFFLVYHRWSTLHVIVFQMFILMPSGVFLQASHDSSSIFQFPVGQQLKHFLCMLALHSVGEMYMSGYEPNWYLETMIKLENSIARYWTKHHLQCFAPGWSSWRSVHQKHILLYLHKEKTLN